MKGENGANVNLESRRHTQLLAPQALVTLLKRDCSANYNANVTIALTRTCRQLECHYAYVYKSFWISNQGGDFTLSHMNK